MSSGDWFYLLFELEGTQSLISKSMWPQGLDHHPLPTTFWVHFVVFFLICRFPTSSRILQLILVIYIFKDIFHFAKILRFIPRGVCIVLPCKSLNRISGSAQVTFSCLILLVHFAFFFGPSRRVLQSPICFPDRFKDGFSGLTIIQISLSFLWIFKKLYVASF